jgi:HEPN domain-containing protein
LARAKYLSWFLQSESDLRATQALIDSGHFSQACFAAQQASEKALKALAFFRGAKMVKSHSLSEIAKELGINGVLESHSIKLDLYYLTARYPDALPDNAVPAEKFNKSMASEAISMASEFISKVKAELKL